MLNLDDMDIGTLLRLEANLSDQTLDGFLEFIRQHYWSRSRFLPMSFVSWLLPG